MQTAGLFFFELQLMDTQTGIRLFHQDVHPEGLVLGRVVQPDAVFRPVVGRTLVLDRKGFCRVLGKEVPHDHLCLVPAVIAIGGSKLQVNGGVEKRGQCTRVSVPDGIVDLVDRLFILLCQEHPRTGGQKQEGTDENCFSHRVLILLFILMLSHYKIHTEMNIGYHKISNLKQKF